MATIIVKHRVENWETWKRAFDGHEAERRKYGWLGHTVQRGSDDPNTIVIIGSVQDLARAREFAASPELKSVMMKAGVLGPPDIQYLEEAEARRY